ncbi:Polyamine aminopropyltransferase (Putrescine aminopropyltransferase) (PAPT) (Spermidine synthase) (SPDS) (SPDSY) [Durusdinium trenchii]|uniref:Polyamine aminopropyltransferase (Putrescine aminopropyltransferase) (PAPT) (Spermidine synthase) (SPDS) (SPDSY) n=1 Tax=Durusdinium trenchii TaxID=1381693 RepID=A0ABP0LTH2_9DINO
MALPGGGDYIGGDTGFAGYMGHVVLTAVVAVGLPVTAMGVLLPYLFKLAEADARGPGETVGALVMINTLAAIAGSVGAGCVLLGWLGLWPSLRLMAALYLAAALWLVVEKQPKGGSVRLAPIVGMLILITLLDTSRLPLVRTDPIEKEEMLLKVWEGADGTVAVVRQGGHLRTKLNNWYTLGGTGDTITQQIQTHLPMLLHENPKRVFYLGLGTGITAGAVLDYPVESVVVAEIAPSVIKASREFFSEYTNGLFDDPRVSVIAEDGRNVLRGAQSEFDLIISDLFIPWKAGTGTLYSVEHYQASKRRLREGGLYAQWIPLYQVTQEEFAIITRSMLEVFPTVTLWRGNFWADRPVVALIGHREAAILESSTPLLVASQRALEEHKDGVGDTVPLIAHYAGGVSKTDTNFSDAPVNTDNRPVIEYRAPINHRLEKAGRAEWFTDERMLDFMAERVNRDALATDAYLSGINPAWRDVVQAGYYFHASKALKSWEHEDADVAEQAYRDLLQQTAIELGRRALQ